jgi:major membrane immunogen (membrane-anchored lipoprotein)
LQYQHEHLKDEKRRQDIKLAIMSSKLGALHNEAAKASFEAQMTAQTNQDLEKQLSATTDKLVKLQNPTPIRWVSDDEDEGEAPTIASPVQV